MDWGQSGKKNPSGGIGWIRHSKYLATMNSRDFRRTAIRVTALSGLILTLIPAAAAAAAADVDSSTPSTAALADSAARDTSAHAPSAAAALQADPLLPEILSPGERLMWGEHGLMRKIGAFPLTEEGRERELGLRRTMLTVHELAGFATLAAMLTTVTYGQLTLNGHTSLGETHRTWAYATIGSYFFTAAMSLLSPPPMIRRKEWSTISVHKGLALIHFSGMILTPLLAKGLALHERGSGASGEKIDRDKAHIHQISGYITTAAFAGAMIAVTF